MVESHQKSEKTKDKSHPIRSGWQMKTVRGSKDKRKYNILINWGHFSEHLWINWRILSRLSKKKWGSIVFSVFWALVRCDDCVCLCLYCEMAAIESNWRLTAYYYYLSYPASLLVIIFKNFAANNTVAERHLIQEGIVVSIIESSYGLLLR